MLLNLNKVNWSQSLKNIDYKEQQTTINDTLKHMAKLTQEYNKWI